MTQQAPSASLALALFGKKITHTNIRPISLIDLVDMIKNHHALITSPMMILPIAKIKGQHYTFKMTCS